MRGLFQTARTISTIDPTALLFAPGGHSPTGVFVAWCNVGTFVRLCFGVSCGIVRARSFVCDHVRTRRGRGVAVVTRPWRPWMWLWRGAAVAVAPAVFLPQSCGCDTPTNASVSNGLCGVRVVLTCYLTG